MNERNYPRFKMLHFKYGDLVEIVLDADLLCIKNHSALRSNIFVFTEDLKLLSYIKCKIISHG